MAIKYQVTKNSNARVHQGDIFRNVPFYEAYSEKSGVFELAVLEFPYSIVLTQECDLEQNSAEKATLGTIGPETIKHDKYLISLLCAPLYNAEHLFAGEHLSNLAITSEKKPSEQRKYIKSNRDQRYHYLEFEGDIEIVPTVIDFKHYFSISLSYLESNMNNRVCSVKPIFRESISQRFSNFLARIGLPESAATDA